MKYESVASIFRQCESLKADRTHSLSAKQSAMNRRYKPSSGKSSGNRLNLSKGKVACRRYQKFGHCKDDHDDDGSLKSANMGSDKPLTNNTTQATNNN